MALTVTNATYDGRPTGVRCDGGTIVAFGGDVTAEPEDEVIDADGMHLVEPLINGHTHAAMTLFRSFGDDLPLMEWLQTKIWPAEAELTGDDVYWGTRLAAIEMIRSGTSTFVDMYWHGTDTARAVDDAGLRAVVGAVLIDGFDPEKAAELRDEASRSLDELSGFGARVVPSLAPHAVYTVSTESLRWVAEQAAARDVPVHIHLSETRGEVEDCLAAHGKRPPTYLDEVGLLGPGSILAHGSWLEPDELDLIAARGATVVANPVSNMKLAGGRSLPYLQAVRAGVALGLGTDGTASNNNHDMFEQAKIFALLHKYVEDDPAVAPAHEVLELAQGRRSPLLGGSRLAVGEPADFLLVRRDIPEMSVGDVDADLVYAAAGNVVDTTVVDGSVLMRGRVVEGMDECLAEVRGRAARLTAG